MKSELSEYKKNELRQRTSNTKERSVKAKTFNGHVFDAAFWLRYVGLTGLIIVSTLIIPTTGRTSLFA